jgi:Transmembrane domain of unknown function (DUF3566)
MTDPRHRSSATDETAPISREALDGMRGQDPALNGAPAGDALGPDLGRPEDRTYSAGRADHGDPGGPLGPASGPTPAAGENGQGGYGASSGSAGYGAGSGSAGYGAGSGSAGYGAGSGSAGSPSGSGYGGYPGAGGYSATGYSPADYSSAGYSATGYSPADYGAGSLYGAGTAAGAATSGPGGTALAGAAGVGATRAALRRPPTPRSRAAGSRPTRRARLLVRHIDPWSTLKFSLVLAVALFFVWLVAVGVLYAVLDGMGVFKQVNSLYGDVSGTSGGQLISPGMVLGTATVVGAVNIVLFTALATIGAFVYNICSDLVGGIEITLAERE